MTPDELKALRDFLPTDAQVIRDKLKEVQRDLDELNERWSAAQIFYYEVLALDPHSLQGSLLLLSYAKDNAVEQLRATRSLPGQEAAAFRRTLEMWVGVTKDEAPTCTVLELACRYLKDALVAENRCLKASQKKFAHLLRRLERPQPMNAKFDVTTLKTVPIGSLMLTAPATDSMGNARYLCPFHDEKTGSFTVYKNDNHFYCYGCQVHGDVITFVMKQEDLSFVEACKRLQSLL